jgi:hypothetical protein
VSRHVMHRVESVHHAETLEMLFLQGMRSDSETHPLLDWVLSVGDRL